MFLISSSVLLPLSRSSERTVNFPSLVQLTTAALLFSLWFRSLLFPCPGELSPVFFYLWTFPIPPRLGLPDESKEWTPKKAQMLGWNKK